MARYLTTTQYLNSDEGLPIADVSNALLARYISRAESDIDAFMAFDLRLGGFEPHMVMSQGPWDEKRLRMLAPNHPVPIRQVTRYRIQVSNLSTSGAGFFASINPGDAVVNVMQGYVEIVPLQAITYSLSPVILQLALRPPIVQMDCEIGWFLPSFGEQLIDSGDHKNYWALRGYWVMLQAQYTQALASQPAQLPQIPPVIYANGSVVPSGYTINATEGLVTFASARTSTDIITADYCYQIPDNVRDAAIQQTTYLLGQRILNKLGMQGLEMIRSGKQSAKRHFGADVEGPLCHEAASALSQYISVPMA